MFIRKSVLILIAYFVVFSAYAARPVALSKERSLVLGFIASKVRNYPKTTVGDRPAYTVVYSAPNYMNYNAYVQSRTAPAAKSNPGASSNSTARSPASVDGSPAEKAEEKTSK